MKWTHVHPVVAEMLTLWHGGMGSRAYSISSRYGSRCGGFTWDKSGTRTLMNLSDEERQEIIDVAKMQHATQEPCEGQARCQEIETCGACGRNNAAYSILYPKMDDSYALDDIGDGPEEDQ